MATISSVIVCNMALSHIGATSSIASLTEDSSEANACNIWYDWARLQVLEAFDWSFARKRRRLTPYYHPTPEASEYSFRYVYPSDAVKVRKILPPAGRKGKKIAYEIEEADINIVFNGSFSDIAETNEGWTAGTNWSVSAGKATGATASTDLEQTVDSGLTEGEAYTVVFTVSSYTSGTITPKIGGSSGTARSSAGTFTESITAGSTDLLEFTGSSFIGSIDDVSVKPAAGKAILTDVDNALVVYTVDMDDLSRFSPLAIEALSYAIASKIAYTQSGVDGLKDRMEANFAVSVTRAAASNANEESGDEPRDADWIEGRN